MTAGSAMAQDNLLRLRLRVALKLMALLALGTFALVLLLALLSPPGGNVDLPLEVDLAGIEPGALREIEWKGRRVLILHRSPEMLDALPPDDALYDPASRLDRRPRGLTEAHRGFRERWLVVFAESTDLGCPLELVPPGSDPDWVGGFRDQCRAGRYDFAGRVYRGQPAMRNLAIPRHRIERERLILGRS
ncbi:Ubiquinol-cytochrome C reductase iron-sulfur subunit [Thioalkalivibrio nitratireducens DSM 14787]|uniref:Ubiquinol-cytochrome C reductase iron-sulfur subunit n=2 Tax=Thioalkalivibrio nitratireducens TaxID=186931 RepID=L0DXK3_THIND|nr:Ubiquinol-cytochrome C reductase iron-sulfur subunit [Thioalkalivibrio nitratireducens DSM 14787]